MESASTNSYEVHLGFWTNWSYGKIQGATVTLTRRNGGFLIAFLAIFIGMAGKSFWRLGCFALHRYFSTVEPQDGLYHQRQAILRNSDTAQDGAWRLLKTMSAWRSGRRTTHPLRRLLPTIVTAFLISATFGVASIFSSNVTSETLNQVLLEGTRCGTYNMSKPGDESLLQQLTLLHPFAASKANRFLNYGMQCYTNETHIDGCNLYVKPRLSLKSTRGNACPFGDDICKLPNDNLVMDTGLLDSLEDLGINTASDQRFQLRMVYQCAPLKTQGYTSDYNDSDYGLVKRYLYGSHRNVRQMHNFTFELPVNNTYLPNDNTTNSNIPRLEYQLGMQFHLATPDEALLASPNMWFPNNALISMDADVHILFMSAPEIHYAVPVEDAWFSAQHGTSEITQKDGEQRFSAYVQDEPAGAMACTHQVQYCNPNLPEGQRCEPLRGVVAAFSSEAITRIFPDDDHFALVSLVDKIWVFSMLTISNLVTYTGASALRARYALVNGYSGGLPNNQWQLEAEHWIKGALTSLQDVFVETSNGMPAFLEAFRQPPAADDPIAKNMCVNQKIVSTNYSSFNVLGLSVILTIGAIIVVLDIVLEPALAWWQRRKYAKLVTTDPERSSSEGHSDTDRHPLYGPTEWAQTNMLQLQRLAFERAGHGTWSSCDKDVPITIPGQKLAALDLRDLAHPVLHSNNVHISVDSVSEEKVAALKPWGVGRSDTGVDTLVEEGRAGQVVKESQET